MAIVPQIAYIDGSQMSQLLGMVELKEKSVLVVYYEEGPANAIRDTRFRVLKDGICPLVFDEP